MMDSAKEHTSAAGPAVFISHAGTDSERAACVARMLRHAGVIIYFDREHLSLGDSFLSFMEQALQVSNYCLLLWSRAAASSPWVKLEWESALERSVRTKQSFLLVGRLEDIDSPALLAPRLRIDLFPELEHGVQQVLDTWTRDRAAEVAFAKPVACATVVAPNADQGREVYLTSELFDLTVPMTLPPTEPAVVLVERIVGSFNLPRLWQHDGRVGVKFTYSLEHQQRPLAPTDNLDTVGVPAYAVLTLLAKMSPFAAAPAADGKLAPAVFRSELADSSSLALAAADPAAQAILRSALRQAGLRAVRR